MYIIFRLLMGTNFIACIIHVENNQHIYEQKCKKKQSKSLTPTKPRFFDKRENHNFHVELKDQNAFTSR